MKLAILALTLLVGLSGCATPKAPSEVLVPIAVACKTPEPNTPTYRFSPPYENIFDAVRDLMGDREVALAYENELKAALASCK